MFDQCSIVVRSSFVLPSFYLRFSFDSGAEKQPWDDDGTVADLRVHDVKGYKVRRL